MACATVIMMQLTASAKWHCHSVLSVTIDGGDYALKTTTAKCSPDHSFDREKEACRLFLIIFYLIGHLLLALKKMTH